MDSENYTNTNKSYWNERVSFHKKSELYQLEKFKQGGNNLHSLEKKELGEIRGKSILHLQCHFGMDSLSLERLGALVTGIDFSEEAIKAAVELRNELGMHTEFILSDVYTLPEKLNKKFDIVYTSYGVLTWLPDLKRWGNIVSQFLKDEGFFYIAEIHPASMIFDSTPGSSKLQVRYPYFNKEDPLTFVEQGSYADKLAATVNNTTYEWIYSLSDIFMSLIKAGLKIEFFHEFPFTVWEQFTSMKIDSNGYYTIEEEIPLLFSIKAAKD